MTPRFLLAFTLCDDQMIELTEAGETPSVPPSLVCAFEEIHDLDGQPLAPADRDVVATLKPGQSHEVAGMLIVRLAEGHRSTR